MDILPVQEKFNFHTPYAKPEEGTKDHLDKIEKFSIPDFLLHLLTGNDYLQLDLTKMINHQK